MTMNEHMMSQPLWLVVWIGIMVGIHIVAIPLAFNGFKCCLYVSAFSKIWLYAYPWIVPCHFLDTCAHLSLENARGESRASLDCSFCETFNDYHLYVTSF